MEPHHHAEETIFVLDAMRAWVRYGDCRGDLPHRIDLKPGLILHAPDSEGHVLNGMVDGYAECLVIYAEAEAIPK